MPFLQSNGLQMDAVTPLHRKIYAIRHVARTISHLTSAMQTEGSQPATWCIRLIDYCNKPAVIDYAHCLTSFFGEFEHHPDHLLSLQALEASRNADEPMNNRIRFFASRLDIALRVDLLNISELVYYTDNIHHIIESEQNFYSSMSMADVDNPIFDYVGYHANSSASISQQMQLKYDLDQQFKRHIFLHSGDYLQLLTKARGQIKRILGEDEYARKLQMVSEFLDHRNESEGGVAGNHQRDDIIE
jgi:hypothetical protein